MHVNWRVDVKAFDAEHILLNWIFFHTLWLGCYTKSDGGLQNFFLSCIMQKGSKAIQMKWSLIILQWWRCRTCMTMTWWNKVLFYEALHIHIHFFLYIVGSWDSRVISLFSCELIYFYKSDFLLQFFVLYKM